MEKSEKAAVHLIHQAGILCSKTQANNCERRLEGYILNKGDAFMKAKRFNKSLSFTFGIVLIAAMALLPTGCSDKKNEETSSQTTTQAVTEAENSSDVSVIGEGETVFSFSVTDTEGNESLFEVHTDKTTVGEALQECGMIEGEEGEYGLYVKTVNGITLDYDTDGKYWAFYIDGEYASTGVDGADIKEGSAYALKAE